MTYATTATLKNTRPARDVGAEMGQLSQNVFLAGLLFDRTKDGPAIWNTGRRGAPRQRFKNMREKEKQL
jgi:hypothetical protein